MAPSPNQNIQLIQHIPNPAPNQYNARNDGHYLNKSTWSYFLFRHYFKYTTNMIINCPFCNIDEDHTRILARGEKVFAVLSNPRLLPGHTLIIPKRHVEKIADLTQAERIELFNMAIKFQKKIIDKIATGCDMRQMYRPFATESKSRVDHLQIHLLPRESNDFLKSIMQVEKKMWTALVPSERDKFTKKFK